MAESAASLLGSGTSLHGEDIYKDDGIGVDEMKGYSQQPRPLQSLVS